MRVLDLESLRPASQPRCHWRYGLLVEDIEVDGFCCESYGLSVTDVRTGSESRCRHVTVNADRAVALLEQLARCRVTPDTLYDVIADSLTLLGSAPAFPA